METQGLLQHFLGVISWRLPVVFHLRRRILLDKPSQRLAEEAGLELQVPPGDFLPLGVACQPAAPLGKQLFKLVVTHDQLREGANPELYGGWPMILSGLKTLLETGGYLTTPGSLQFQGPQPED